MSNIYSNLDERLITLRKQKYYDMLSNCDSDSSRISLLLDKVIELENSIDVLRISFVEQSLTITNISCAPDLLL